MNKVDFSGVFDTTSSEDVSANEQEVAEPAEQDTEVTDESEDYTESESEEGEEEQESAEPAQSDEDNTKYAAARRKAEQEKAIAIKEAREAARKEAEEQYNQLIAESNLFDPYAQKPVKSIEDYKKWQEAYAKEQGEQVREKLEEAGLDAKEVEQLIRSLPEAREAAQLKKQLEQHEKEVNEQRFKGIVEESLKEIQTYDPTIKSLQDLHDSEHGAEIEDKIQKGYSISDAWKLVNLDVISQKKAAAAKIETANNVRSKEHLNKSTSRGQGAVTVPKNVIDNYKKLIPKATMEQIQKHYEKELKTMKKKG